ncbi:MAG: PIN domain-containing protein [Campylobacterota bacterium]|nr:PIN domain-containing protein [Campylobacterota bacterium]
MKYFFDTNVISRLVNNDKDTIKIIQELTADEESEFYINRLIYMESLRAIPLTHKKLYKDTTNTLNSFEKLDITQDIYDTSVKFARFCKSKGLNFGKCEAIDYLHFITSKNYNLEIISFDGDMEKLKEIYPQFIEDLNSL